MRRLLAILLVCGLGFVLGAALRDATRAEPTAAATDAATAPDLRADFAALEQRVSEQLAEMRALAAAVETPAPQDEPATLRLPEQLTAAPDAPSLAELEALRASVVTLEQRLTDRLDALAAEQRATADLEARLDALESDLAPNPNGVPNGVPLLPNSPHPRP
jgi:hypothetical protein